MKRTLLILIVLLVAACGKGTAQPVPAFHTGEITLKIPAWLPGVTPDSGALLRNDTLIYQLSGQFFSLPRPVALSYYNPAPKTPWELLFSTAHTYAGQDRQKIRQLYNEASRPKVDAMLNGPQAEEYLRFLYQAARSNLSILGGFYYLNGFVAYVKEAASGVHQNFMVSENGSYRLSALAGRNITAANIAVYYRYMPVEAAPVKNLRLPDSLGLDDSVLVSFPLSGAGSYVAVYTADSNATADLLVHDNDFNDTDPASGQVSFYLRGGMFLDTGAHEYYIAAFNYPVLKISSSFLLPAARHRIRIY